MKTCRICLAICILSLLGVSAGAQDYIIWAGGVSQEERDTAPGDGIKLEFFEEGGPYLADIRVTVKDEDGNTMVNTVCPGPWLILDLPTGKFKVIAIRGNGEEEIVNIDTSSAMKSYGFMFSAD